MKHEESPGKSSNARNRDADGESRVEWSARSPMCVLCAMSPTHPCREHAGGGLPG